jgi:putative FmdB family regulatory protein
VALYEFTCKECNHVQEELISPFHLNDVIIFCHNCGSKKMKRLISRPNGIVKGTQTPTRS